MIMRRRPAIPARPSLLGTMARTAVITGTATAVSNRMAKPAVAPAPMPHTAPPQMPAVTSPGGMTAEKLELLKSLGELKAQGILSEEEFAAEKAKLLAS